MNEQCNVSVIITFSSLLEAATLSTLVSKSSIHLQHGLVWCLLNMKRTINGMTLLLAASAAASATSRHGTWKVGQTVHTSSGPVEGHAASNAMGVSEYLGIPYAEPPVGPRRFQPPERLRKRSRIRGDKFASRHVPSLLEPSLTE